MTTVQTKIQNNVASSALSRSVLSIGTEVIVGPLKKGVIRRIDVLTSWGESQVETEVHYQIEFLVGPYKSKTIERHPAANVDLPPPW